MSATNGFGSEAIGREHEFLERLLDIFGHVPIVSSLAGKIVHFLNLDHDSEYLVPKISFILLACFVGSLPFLIRTILHVGLVITRINTRGSAANARWASFFEVFFTFTIPSRFSTNISAYVLAFTVVVWIVLWYFVYFQVIVVIICTVVLGFCIRKYTGPYPSIRTAAQPYPLGKYMGINIYLTGGRRFSWLRGTASDQRQGHVIIVGPSSAGKTTKYYIPGLLEDAGNHCSAIVVEAKASDQEDMFKLIAPTWAAAGKKVMLFDPWSKSNHSTLPPTDKSVPSSDDAATIASLGFNPLLRLKPSFGDPATRDAIELIVDAIYRTYETEKGSPSGDAQYHVDQEKGLFKGLLTICLFRPEAERNLAAVAELVHGTLEQVISYIKSTANLKTTNQDAAKDILKSLLWFVDDDNLYADGRAKMLRGIAGKLAIFTRPRVVPYVTSNQLDLDMIFKEPTLLCIKSPLNIPGASTLASIIIRLLMSRVPHKLAYGAGEDFKVFFYLDELPALSIPRFAEFCKTARSSGTGIIAAIQDRSDLADIIQPKLGTTSIGGLLGNIKTQIYLPGLCPETAKYLSDSFGKKTIKTRRSMRSTTNPVDFNYFTTKEETLLIQPDAIRNMDKNKAIIVDMNTRPFIAETIPWYKSRRYASTIKKNQDVRIKLHNSDSDVIEYKSPRLPEYSNCIDAETMRKRKARKRDAEQGPDLIPDGLTLPQFTGAAHSGKPFEPGQSKNGQRDFPSSDNYEKDLF